MLLLLVAVLRTTRACLTTITAGRPLRRWLLLECRNQDFLSNFATHLQSRRTRGPGKDIGGRRMALVSSTIAVTSLFRGSTSFRPRRRGGRAGVIGIIMMMLLFRKRLNANKFTKQGITKSRN